MMLHVREGTRKGGYKLELTGIPVLSTLPPPIDLMLTTFFEISDGGGG